ncbi:uncharacterized protein N7483_000701 [Penicillium malachiteum]|uniref:uncharacterized protein n=1 Tax=Penicillium malachiteum TaxID=1324776 RepID=UPI002548AB08|nr:uncharacterized protein N7483_000701 [Penicillium malachiteum]KAJ5735576.1 hypothetical protein N7483_000701 [Penicillium malachiteum]
MFSRRKRSSSQHRQPLSAPASQSAQSAASHAFLRSQPSTSSLSSAAAAAALRNRTPTPTSVENVQTKRMMQRASSTHSPNNPLVTRRSASVSGTLRRSNSSGSMSARTFREPSPHRPSTSSGPSSGPVVTYHQFGTVPPLPNLPAQYAGRAQQPARRAASIEPSMRSPPASPSSPARTTPRVRGGSTSPLHNRISSLSTVPEDRPGSRGSVNFSYPRGARPNSPPPSPLIAENRPASLGPATARNFSATERAGTLQTTPQKPITAEANAQNVGGSDGHTSKTAGPALGKALAAAQRVSTQKSDRGPDPQVRATRVEQESSTKLQLRVPSNESSVVNSGSEIDHPSSRVVPERWPATVPEETEPTERANTEMAGNRFAASSPTPAQNDDEVTPQSSPSAAVRDPKQQQELLQLRQSGSPGRSARFSKWLSVSSNESQIHQPPGRSVSPVKSAMKHTRGTSVSPDRRASMSGLTVQPVHEFSDGTSIASDEGSRLGVKKRAPKVSFDEEAEIVGIAASPPTSPEDYTPGSPPAKVKSRMSWLGVGKKKGGSENGVDDNDFGGVLKPRQVLPSFGSVRGNRDGGAPGPAIPEFSDNESSSSSDEEVGTNPISFSNDHAIGGLLPQIQKVEKTHDVKSLEQLSVIGEPSPPQQQPTKTKIDGMSLGITNQPPFANANSNLPPPSIAVEPATPPVDMDRPSRELHRVSRSSLEYTIPGGFPLSASDRNLRSAAESAKSQPVTSAVPKLVDDVDTEGESGDSVYSDAAEDFDGDGFGSINAIVDARSIPRSSGPVEPVHESRDTTPKAADRSTIIDDESKDVTEQAAEHGRAITPTQDSVNREIEESPVAVSVVPEVEPRVPARAVPNGPIQPETRQQRRPMSVDVYAANLQDPRHQSTNRSSAAAGKPKPRPMSMGPAFHRTKGSGGAAFPTSLRRTMSSGSDSSSSFKRANSSVRGDGARSMRRTMRSGAAGMQGPPSDRTDSPIDRRPTSSGSNQGTMRKTLRGPPGGDNERYSFFSTNKKAVSAPRGGRLSKNPSRSAQGTRFKDSDEEGERQPQVFRSRFADSSDEGEKVETPMRPVRGIPRRMGAYDGDSTDLEDSSEEDRRQKSHAAAAPRAQPARPATRDQNANANMSGMAAVARQRGMTQRELEEFIMQPQGRKGGFLSRLGLKKSKNPENRIRKADAESPSRRDTPLERSRLERENLRDDSFVNGASRPAVVTTVTATQPEAPSSSPQKLLKKNSKRYTTGGEPWPLRSFPGANASEPIPEQPAIVSNSPSQTQKPPAEQVGRNGSTTINGTGEGLASSAIKTPESPIGPRAGPDLNDDAASDMTRSTADEHGPVARDVVIAGSGRKETFPHASQGLWSTKLMMPVFDYLIDVSTFASTSRWEGIDIF